MAKIKGISKDSSFKQNNQFENDSPNETEIKVHDLSENNMSKINADSP
jgi:hypothetical protein